MSRQYFVNGATLVKYGGAELGITDRNGIVTITITPQDEGIDVDAWGATPPELQLMNAEASISMTLVHYDPVVLAAAVQAAMGGSAPGVVGQPGALMVAGGLLVPLQLSSPIGQKPWTFPNAYLPGNPIQIPLGVRKTLVSLGWRAITVPSNGDPYQNGQGALGVPLFTNT